MMQPLILASASKEDTERLSRNGPRRDFVELAGEVGATILYSQRRARRGGLFGRLLGPHVRQAWAAARQAKSGQVLFADGEHNGIPLLFFLALRGKRLQRVVMLGHYPSKPWKRRLLAAATRLVPHGDLVLHSVTQRDRLRGALSAGWTVHLVPYHVDSEFWARETANGGHRPLFVAVGAENRDYATLVDAAQMVESDIFIAGASHWARAEPTAQPVPPTVQFSSEPLDYADLRALYSRARAVVVPLFDVQNQSGITTILEGMSMGLPVIVSATAGQRETVRGPVIRGDASIAEMALDRGPHVLLPGMPPNLPPNGIYVPPGDAEALAAAMSRLTRDAAEAACMGKQGRADVRETMDTRHFVERLAHIMQHAESPQESSP